MSEEPSNDALDMTSASRPPQATLGTRPCRAFARTALAAQRAVLRK